MSRTQGPASGKQGALPIRRRPRALGNMGGVGDVAASSVLASQGSARSSDPDQGVRPRRSGGRAPLPHSKGGRRFDSSRCRFPSLCVVVAQSEEQRSPKPQVVGSSPTHRARRRSRLFSPSSPTAGGAVWKDGRGRVCVRWCARRGEAGAAHRFCDRPGCPRAPGLNEAERLFGLEPAALASCAAFESGEPSAVHQVADRISAAPVDHA